MMPSRLAAIAGAMLAAAAITARAQSDYPSHAVTMIVGITVMRLLRR